MNYASRLTSLSQRRAPSAIRKLIPLMSQPGMISLGGGNPNPSLFPINAIKFELDGKELELSQQQVADALQYSATPGMPWLVDHLRQLQEREHDIHTHDVDRSICVTSGSQDSFCKVLEMLVSPTDNLLVDSPCYSGALAFLQPYGCGLVQIHTDHMGLRPDVLDDTLSNWNSPSNKPRVLYTVPTAGNPSGATTVQERRNDIYDIARKHDLLILEDDPYWFMHPYRNQSPPSGGDRLRSLMSMDTDGRVIRFDSFSKVISSGIRVGWATGPTPLINQMNLHIQGTNLHTSGISQAMIARTLDEWGYEGLNAHIDQIVSFYKSQGDALCRSASKHLTGLAEWNEPEAGMFLWLKLIGVEDSAELIENHAVKAKVLLVPGQAFNPDKAMSSYVRASFSTATPEEMDEAMSRLATLLREHAKA